MSEQLYRVKGLEWREAFAGTPGYHWRSDVPFGVIDLYRTLDNGYWWCCGMRCSDTKCHASLESAKADAEQWYLNQLQAALEPVEAT